MQSIVVCVSRRDPFCFGMVGDDAFLGPALSAIVTSENDCDSVTLLVVAGREREADDLAFEVEARLPGLPVQRAAFEDLPPVSHTFIVDAADAESLAELILRFRNGQAEGRLLVVEPAARPGSAASLVEHPVSVDSASEILVREPAHSLYRTQAPAISAAPEAVQCGILGSHPALSKAIQTAVSVAPHPVPVLLQGETGTGKELFARYVHACSARSDEPFIAVNCAALPEKLVESTLFGHKRGAFTGADRDMPGKFLEASGGTLFLDEVADLPLEQQPKLLRALQEGIVDPVGGQPVEVDVRVVAASHKNLAAAVRDGHFREDLYYRLAYAAIPLPALRERASDIPELAEHLMRDWNRSLRAPRRLSVEALERLRQHPWPGNVRELQAVIGRSLMMGSADILGPDDLLFEAPLENPVDLPIVHEGFSLEAYLRDHRCAIILQALQACGHNASAAARLLGMSPQAVTKFVNQQKEKDD